MFVNTRKSIAAIAAAMLVASFAGTAIAQETVPTGKEILTRYIEKTGGKEKYEAIKTLLVTSKMEFVGANIVANLSIRTAEPNLVAANFDIPGIGVIKRGTDGTHGWEENPMSGPRLIEGAELAAMLEESDMTNVVDFEKQYTSLETIGTEEINGKKTYKVELTSKSGRKETRFYDVETGYLVRTNAVQQTQMGELPTQVDMGDYKEVGGIMIPHTTSVVAGPQMMKMTVVSVEANVTHPADAFQPSKDIQDLIKSTEAEKAPTTKPSN